MSSKRKTKQKLILIANPCPGGRTHAELSNALRAVRKGKAILAEDGKLYYLTTALPKDAPIGARLQAVRVRNSGRLVVSEYAGFDAMPDAAVMPQWPDARELRVRRPLRPPLAPSPQQSARTF